MPMSSLARIPWSKAFQVRRGLSHHVIFGFESAIRASVRRRLSEPREAFFAARRGDQSCGIARKYAFARFRYLKNDLWISGNG
jgi:hypothetical protein